MGQVYLIFNQLPFLWDTSEPGYIITGPTYNYKIEKVLGIGGFGITYLTSTKIKVGNVSIPAHFAIKEHFLKSDCERENGSNNVIYSNPARNRVERSLKDFISEAHRLQKVGTGHNNIVKVNEVFETNNTAYYVMEYLNGVSLKTFVSNHTSLPTATIIEIFNPIVEAVKYLHSERITHLDIKPDNIMIVTDDDGKLLPILIDFGLAKHYDGEGNPTSTINLTGFTPGYAPIEQYAGLNQFSPQADIYSLGATLWFILTGKNPPSALEIIEGELANALPLSIDENLRYAIRQSTKRLNREYPVLYINSSNSKSNLVLQEEFDDDNMKDSNFPEYVSSEVEDLTINESIENHAEYDYYDTENGFPVYTDERPVSSMMRHSTLIISAIIATIIVIASIVYSNVKNKEVERSQAEDKERYQQLYESTEETTDGHTEIKGSSKKSQKTSSTSLNKIQGKINQEGNSKYNQKKQSDPIRNSNVEVDRTKPASENEDKKSTADILTQGEYSSKWRERKWGEEKNPPSSGEGIISGTPHGHERRTVSTTR